MSFWQSILNFFRPKQPVPVALPAKVSAKPYIPPAQVVVVVAPGAPKAQAVQAPRPSSARLILVPETINFAQLAPALANNYYACVILPQYRSEVEGWARKAIANRARYEAVQKATGVPWYFVAGSHMRESSINFNGCLANGELIIGTGRKTHLVPAGKGPYTTWEQSAVEALELVGIAHHAPSYWTFERQIYQCNAYNGFGNITSKGRASIPARTSPYVFAHTSAYQSGKYVADHVFDSHAKDGQCGVAALWKALESHGVKIT